MMPSLKKRVVGFIRQFSHNTGCADEEQCNKYPFEGSFIHRYLTGDLKRDQPEVLYGKTVQDLPVLELDKLSPIVCASYTGPKGGLINVNRKNNRSQQQCNAAELEVPELQFADEDSSWKPAKLAEPEDLEEFLDNPSPSKKNQVHYWNSYNGGSPVTKSKNCKCRHSLNNNSQQVCNQHSENNNDDVENCPKHNSSNGDVNGHSEQEVDGEEVLLESTLLCDDTDFAESENLEIAGIDNWNNPCPWAFGAATTLYERHPLTLQNAGDPVADVFAICARENNSILVLADGVNWGERSCLAARCAVHGCIDYLNRTIFGNGCTVQTTEDVFVVLLRSIFSAHHLILQEDGMLTTLCAAFICPLRDSDEYVMCACNVGDSLAYVYSRKHGVRETTLGSHDIYSMRDMRDALGALGPVDGRNPELGNLTCSMTRVEKGDIVFLTSDGISDNFDPVVGKFAIPREEPTYIPTTNNGTNNRNRLQKEDGEIVSPPIDLALPAVEAVQRHDLTLLRMEDLLNNGVTVGDGPCGSALQLCEALVDFATKLTVAKRRILEDPDLYQEGDQILSRHEQKQRRKKLCDKLGMVPGKLDHASVVAYEVGAHRKQKVQCIKLEEPVFVRTERVVEKIEEEVVVVEEEVGSSLADVDRCTVVVNGTVNESLNESKKTNGFHDAKSTLPKVISDFALVCPETYSKSLRESLV